MSDLVGAVKSYAYMDRGELVEVDVHEGLETTLTVLAHKLKHTAIDVVRDYDRSLPRLTVRGSELNQVWTNLLDNAIDALGERGTLTIRTSRGRRVRRSSTSPTTARASPPRRATTSSSPFFTTKDVGQRDGPGPRHRAPDRRGAPPRDARLRHRPAGHDVPRLSAPSRGPRARSRRGGRPRWPRPRRRARPTRPARAPPARRRGSRRPGCRPPRRRLADRELGGVVGDQRDERLDDEEPDSVPTTAATWLRTSTPMPTPSIADSATDSTPPPPLEQSLPARSGPGSPLSSGSRCRRRRRASARR